MNTAEILQNVATGSVVFLGITYILGGLIVNLNLARRGLVEYQVLKVKYLAVGVIFLLQFTGVLMVSSMLAFLLLPQTGDIFIVQGLNLISVLASLALLHVWTLHRSNTLSFLRLWRSRFMLSVSAMVFPALVFLYQVFRSDSSIDWIVNTVLAVAAGALALMAHIYHYATFYYGQPAAGFYTSDPVGMGIPTAVNLLIDETISKAVSEMGLRVRKDIVHDVYLIDETSQHYIVSEEQVPGRDGKNKTYKIDKSLVKVILHMPEHIRQLEEAPPEKEMNPTPAEPPSDGRGLSLWERINRDPRYREATHEIQRRYGLPLPFDIRSEPEKWSDWLGDGEAPSSEGAGRGRLFMEEVHALLKKFQVPDAWYPDFIAEIASPSSEGEE
ncbi:MAG TPA: hypothetical protein VFS61_08360 [Anaerolineales bacterium]|nr:hypothetical protein [Anaerolineales bacterium]